jgi:cytochrome o ubiquinol oxidase subunit 3
VSPSPEDARADDAGRDGRTPADQASSGLPDRRAAPGPAAARHGWWKPLLGAAVVATAFLAPFRVRGDVAVPAGPAPGGDLSGATQDGLRADAGGRTPLGPPREDRNQVGHGGGAQDRQRNTEHGEREPASKRIIVGYGFWIFLLSDIIMFAAFFASYVVLSGETAGGPGGRELFDLRNTAIETGCLLLSSFTCGVATVGLQTRRSTWFYGAMAATFVLGAAFIGLEVSEFAGMVADGNGPQRSAFLSAFFTLVGCHGLHVTAGLLWLLTMMAQVFAKGYRDDILRRVLCFSLFWHALDIVWVALFTVVYLIGAGQ